jgi:hypothetical protein
MKRRTATALIVIAVWCIIPFPWSAQDKSTKHVEKKAADNKNQPQPFVPSIVKADPSQEAEQPGANIAGKDVDHRIRIGTPVVVNSVKDRWDKALVICTGLIVVIGISQIIFLWKTVVATSDNAKALINSERAWVMAEIQWNPQRKGIVEGTSITLDKTVDETTVELCLICKNEGKTPAWIVEKRILFRITDSLSSTPRFDVQPGDFFDLRPEPLGVGQPSKICTALECADRRGNGKAMIVYGFVKYRDVFKPERETRFGYRITIQGTLERIAAIGEKDFYQYNSYT